MKIAVSSSGNNLAAQLDPRFGRCSNFIIVDSDDLSFEALENESMSLGGGAGIQAAQFLATKGINAVITGNCGPNAIQTLNAAGIDVFVGQQGTVKEVIDRYKNGSLKPMNQPTVGSHFGMSPKSRSSRGRGTGRGRGNRGGSGAGLGKSGFRNR
jgi:predicted Fe-Mo cluster-binding NifX family protein